MLCVLKKYFCTKEISVGIQKSSYLGFTVPVDGWGVSTGLDLPIVNTKTMVNVLLRASIFEETIECMLHLIFLGVT